MLLAFESSAVVMVCKYQDFALEVASTAITSTIIEATEDAMIDFSVFSNQVRERE